MEPEQLPPPQFQQSQQAPQPEFHAQQQPVAPLSPQKKSKKLLIVLLIVWLMALPTAIGLGALSVSLIPDSPNTSINSGVEPLTGPQASTVAEEDDGEMARAVLNICALLLGIYGLVGWIPVLIVGIKSSKK